ncbi:MAG: hypothetical protein IPN08_10660 [Bacteroidales bacterium]|nr:hypothetical protein [Bacteroidales bacterium]
MDWFENNGLGTTEDAPSYNTVPATLDNVLIKNNRISGPQNGIRIGEYGKTKPATNTGQLKDNRR